MPAFILVSAVHSGQGVREQAVEMDRAILVVLRYENVPETTAAHLIIQPVIEPARDFLDVVAVDALAVERERDEPSKIVGEREIAHSDAGAPLRAGQRRGASLGFFVLHPCKLILALFNSFNRLFRQRRQLRKAGLTLFPASFPENCPVGDLNDLGAVRIRFDVSIVLDMLADFKGNLE